MYDVLKVEEVSKNITNLTFTDYYYRLMLLAKAIFKWDGLPKGIDEKWIERYLFSEGHCMFFHDDKLGYMVSRCNLSDGLNFYDEPVSLIPYATGYTEHKPYKNNKECVLIRNNDLMIPTAPTLQLYALRLAEIQRTIDINISAQQTPTLITGSKNQKLTLMQIYKKWQGHEPVIYGDKGLDTSPLNVLKTDAPIVFDKLQIQKHAMWNEVMTFLGVNNANMDKRERLVDDEVQANNEQIEMSAQIMLKSREKACELINTLYPELNVSVSLRNKEEIQQVLEDGIDD